MQKKKLLNSPITSRFILGLRMNAISQANDSVEQAMSRASIFPSESAPPKEPKRSHLGYATEKSKNGAITYYASVDKNGQVSFSPGKEIKIASAEHNIS
jgi:hypothetical protein